MLRAWGWRGAQPPETRPEPWGEKGDWGPRMGALTRGLEMGCGEGTPCTL